jgi:hypothetical protein
VASALLVPLPVPVSELELEPLLEPEPLSSVAAELELLPSELLSLAVPSGLTESLSVADAVGPLVSVGSGIGLVVPVVGGMLVSPPVVPEVVSVSCFGTAHSPMHTGSGSPHAGTEDERRSRGPRTAIELRFICTNLVRTHASGLARAKARPHETRAG